MRKLLPFALLALIFTGSTAFIISSGGMSNTTGSPGEGTCSGCHVSGSGITTVSFSALPAFTGNQFIPGQTYTVSITVANNAFAKFGFDAEILNPSNVNAGNITTGLAGVQIVNLTRKNATHTTPKSGTGSANFDFVWVAPTSGTATIYAAGNAIDGNGNAVGDKGGNSALVLTANTGAAVNEATKSGISGLNVYPNPVKTDFRIAYNLMEDARVKAALYDILGREIAELNNERQSAGAHYIVAQLPEGLVKGAYFVKLSIEGKQIIQRLIITQ